VLSPDTVYNLDNLSAQKLAGESEELAAERVCLVEKLRLLEDGLRGLRRLDKHRMTPIGEYFVPRC
jgi:hypothetical protein